MEFIYTARQLQIYTIQNMYRLYNELFIYEWITKG